MITNVDPDQFMADYQRQMQGDLNALWHIIMLFVIILILNYILIIQAFRRPPGNGDCQR